MTPALECDARRASSSTLAVSSVTGMAGAIVLCHVPALSRCTCHAANPTAAMKAAWQSTAREQYGLGAEQLEAVEAHLQQAVAKEQHSQAEVVRKQELLGKKWTDADIQHLLGGHAHHRSRAL